MLEHTEMQNNTKLIGLNILVGLFSLIVMSSVIADELTVAKSDDVYEVPDDYEKQGSQGKYSDYSESVLEDGRLFVQLNLASYHPGADSDDDFNEFNPGIGLEYHLEHFYIAGGFFENSIDNFSTYWGAGTERTFFTDWFGLGILGGIVTGYDDGFSPRLAAVPYVYFQKNRFSLKSYYVPAVGDVDEDAIGFAMRFDLGGLF